MKRVTSCDPPRDTCSYPDREWAMNLRSYAKTKRSSRTKGSSSTPKGVVTDEKKRRKERRRMEKVKERRRTRTEGPVLGEFLERFVRTFVELARCLRGIRIRRSPDRCTGRRLSSDPRWMGSDTEQIWYTFYCLPSISPIGGYLCSNSWNSSTMVSQLLGFIAARESIWTFVIENIYISFSCVI